MQKQQEPAYPFIRPLLFLLDPETAHQFVLSVLRFIANLPGGYFLMSVFCRNRVPQLPVKLMGMEFMNPVGLAAGLDKDGTAYNGLRALGFGWVELGTVTPLPQPGNPKKRLFRLTREHAIINRMGFNNDGAQAFLNRMCQYKERGIIGINIGKNKDTPNERAIDDYVTGLRTLGPIADYIAVNISSPNTPDLRELQSSQYFDELLSELNNARQPIRNVRGMPLPLAIKIAPDLSDEDLTYIAQSLLRHNINAVIATNTTVLRPVDSQNAVMQEPGGLSGLPLRNHATQLIAKLYLKLQGRVPIIGVGGIESAEDAWEKMIAGAELVQIYTGLIYRGPHLIKEIVDGLIARIKESGCANLSEAVMRTRIAVGQLPGKR